MSFALLAVALYVLHRSLGELHVDQILISTTNLATISERFGGGGHAKVAAISLPPGDLERAREIAREIVAELRASLREH